MTFNLKKPVYIGCRWPTVNGGLGTTLTEIPAGTRVQMVGCDGGGWKVVSNTIACCAWGYHEYTRNVKNFCFTTLDNFAAGHV